MIESLNASHNQNMAYQFTTSSGDSVSLKMGVEESAAFRRDERRTTLEWMRSIHTEISIEGNGLSEEDMDEIDTMMAKMQPTIDSFFTQEKTPLQETIRSIKEAIPPLLTKEKADALGAALLDNGIERLENPDAPITKSMDAIRSFYEEIIRKLRDNAPLDLTV